MQIDESMSLDVAIRELAESVRSVPYADVLNLLTADLWYEEAHLSYHWLYPINWFWDA